MPHDNTAPSFVPTSIELDIPILKGLAKKHNKTLTFYDLETTNLLAAKTFGITDVGAVHVHPDGTCTQQSSLLDPENPISPEASNVTGITQDMVDGQATWAQAAMAPFREWMVRNIVLGFNNIAFDNPGIISQNVRYGDDPGSFLDTRDVRSMARIMTGTGKGKLVDLAQRYGINPDGAHRAIFDVVMTVKVLENMLAEYGLELFEHPGAKITASRPVENLFRPAISRDGQESEWINQEDRILEIIDACGYHSTERLANMLGMDRRYCGDLVDSMIMDGRMDYAVVEDPQAQKWLLARVPHVIGEAWIGAARGKYKPIFESVKANMKVGLLPDHQGSTQVPSFVTYTQLKVFLKAQGYIAALEKSADVASVPRTTSFVESSSMAPA
jgi:DNA polymerase III epsilon subunit-like protein